MPSTPFPSRYRTAARIALALIVSVVLTAAIEVGMGRSIFGPDGRFGWWDGDIWSSENSQRVADAYSFSHVVHGILFFGILWWWARRWSLETRFLIALAVEAAWEVWENTPFIINRYREATIAQGYDGDSVLNSTCDIVMMAIGFAIAVRVPVRWSVLLVLAMEIGCLLWVRDNLTLNIVMLIWPIDAIKTWQEAGRPLP